MLSPEALLAIQHLAQLAAAFPGEVHPSGRITIMGWLSEAQHALAVGDNAEASRLIRGVNEKAARELAWHGECLGIAANVVAEVTRRAAVGDIQGAAERLREAAHG